MLMSEPRREALDYAAAKEALDCFVGRKVSVRVSPFGGATVAEIGIGYLQPSNQFGTDSQHDDEVTRYPVGEQLEPKRDDRHPFWPDVRIHDVPDFK